jgi:hypothetical protein
VIAGSRRVTGTAPAARAYTIRLHPCRARSDSPATLLCPIGHRGLRHRVAPLYANLEEVRAPTCGPEATAIAREIQSGLDIEPMEHPWLAETERLITP